MTSIEFSPSILADFDRIFDHLEKYDSDAAQDRIASIIGAIDLLRHSPQIGRPVTKHRRELVIGRASKGYVALYEYVELIDTVFVLAIRSQREAGFSSET